MSADRLAVSWMSPEELAYLRRLVYQAFDLREGPYLCDAAEAIVDWWERTEPDRLERRAQVDVPRARRTW